MVAVCKDCAAVWDQLDIAPPKKPRPATPPGPRCATHHRMFKEQQKASAHAARVIATYGLVEGEYFELYKFQGGCCAICRKATGATRRLSVDHDHKTDKVRGLLCRPCNNMLGHGRDDPYFFQRAMEYLRWPPYDRFKGAQS